MSEPAPVPADQEEALWVKIREAWAAAERIALKTAREKLEIKAYAEAALAECATLRAERDQLAPELREAREALHWALSMDVSRHEYPVALSDPRPSPAKGDDHGA